MLRIISHEARRRFAAWLPIQKLFGFCSRAAAETDHSPAIPFLSALSRTKRYLEPGFRPSQLEEPQYHLSRLLLSTETSDQARQAWMMVKEFQERGMFSAPDRILFMHAIQAHAKAGAYSDAFDIVLQMTNAGHTVDQYVVGAMLQHLNKLPPDDPSYTPDTVLGLIFDLMRISDITPSTFICTTLLQHYRQTKQVDKVLEVMALMEQHSIELNLVGYNTLLTLFAELDMIEQMQHVISSMKAANIEPDHHSYEALFAAMVNTPSSSDQNQMLQLLDTYEQNYGPAPVWMYNKLIEAYDHVDKTDDAIAVLVRLRGIEQRAGRRGDLRTYSSLLSSLAKSNNLRGAEYVFQALHDAKCQPTAAQYNTLLSMYVRTNVLHNCSMIFAKMNAEGVAPDVETFQLLLVGFSRNGQVEKVAQVFNDLVASGLPITPYLCDLAMATFERHVEHADRVAEVMKHRGIPLSVASLKSLVRAHCEKSPDNALKLIEDVEKDTGTTAFATIFQPVFERLAHEPHRVLALARKLVQKGIHPDISVFERALRGFCKLDEETAALDVVTLMTACGFSPSPSALQLPRMSSALDWTCPGCKKMHFARVKQCPRCGTFRVKHSSVFWTCPACRTANSNGMALCRHTSCRQPRPASEPPSRAAQLLARALADFGRPNSSCTTA
eukprot:gnl/Spiro4/7763_TR4082_c0_g1_i1.p1 gnl/Spiro4/7763_TR4082_c0_g1~~gnl/Spiro4/7763_TR4082_c0_g1_i1.p1  ORF type:complete len:668 (-),score=158.66 gnl/Spiro4/7763_TR4082_c0_g1_i1:111-2114(-)